MKQFSPGVRFDKPDHVYWYDFVVRSDHQQDKLLWSFQIYQYDSMEGVYAKFQIFDVDLQDSDLIVTWLDFGLVCANILRPDAQHQYQPMRWQDTHLQGDNSTFGPVAIGAEIEGSLKLGTLSVVITNGGSADVIEKMGGNRIRFAFKDTKWVLVGPVPETPDVPTDSKKVQEDKK